MAKSGPPSQIGRSVAAVAAGFLAVFVLSLGAGALLHALGLFPGKGLALPDSLLLVATLYRTAFGVLGSYLTARLAPYRPIAHALTGAAIGMFIGIVGAAVTWNKGPQFGPHWYPVSLIALALPTGWLGGWLWLRKSRRA